MPYGTLQIADAFINEQRTILQYGEVALYDNLVLPALARHEKWAQELTSLFCERSTDFLRGYGEVSDVENEEMGEQSRPDASKAGRNTVNIGFPIRRYGSSVQWTRDYQRVTGVGEFAQQLDSHTNMDRRRIIWAIKKAIFTPTNNPNYKDTLPSRKTANIAIPLRAFYNADGLLMPDGPNGEDFDPVTHTHYKGRAGGALAASDVKALISNVLEHDTEGQIYLYINQAQEDAIRGMTGPGEFVPFVDARIRQAQDTIYALGQGLNVQNSGDREIGIFGPATVVVKPWMPAGYLYAADANGGKPLLYRIPEDDPTLGNFDVRATDEKYPLRANTLARDFGVSVARRGKGAVLYIGGTTYVAPTLTV